jgi:single-stranded-DNA-specific exonuclease
MMKRWRTLQPDPLLAQSLSKKLSCHPITALVLINRGITSTGAARAYLASSLTQLSTPFGIKDIEPAVQRISKAIDSGETIRIFGDYDVDGITATLVLYEFLKSCGAEVSYTLPHRLKDGYGLQPAHIQQFTESDRPDVLITADCGTGSIEAVREANRRGIDVIVTDHHSLAGPLPDAVAVVNPKRPDCDAGFAHLAGVGVALCLVVCLRKHLRDAGFWQSRSEPNLRKLCDLVALGTIADGVPLTGDNRVLVRTGLDVIRKAKFRAGLTALINRCNGQPDEIGAEQIAYRVIPRLNAAGRMESAALAAALLSTSDAEEAARMVDSLNALNDRRRQVEGEILRACLDHLTADPKNLQKRALVLSRKNWHPGVLGIVAARLAERYHRPVVLISMQQGLGKGSGRSISGIDITSCLAACAQHLDGFGGHAMAAGLKVTENNLQQFRETFEKQVAGLFTEVQPTPEVVIDCELALGEISDTLIDEIESMEPYGAGNPNPLFRANHLAVRQSQIVGDTHRRMRLHQSGDDRSRSIGAIQFNVDPNQPPPEAYARVAFRLQWNRWNGRKLAQLVIEDAVPA